MVRGTGKFKTEHGGGRNFSRGVVLDNDMIVVSGTPRGENTKKEDATGTVVGTAQPKLTRNERRKFYKERAVQKQDGTGSSQDLVLDQNGTAASRAPRGEDTKKEDATGASVGAQTVQPQLTRTERRKLNKERAAQKLDGTTGSSQDLVLGQNGIAASGASRGGNAKKDGTTGTSAGAAKPQLTRAERRELQKKRAVQKQDGVTGASNRDLVLDRNVVAVWRPSCGKNAKKNNVATGIAIKQLTDKVHKMRWGTEKRRLMRIERRKFYKKRAAQKRDGTGDAFSRFLVLDQNGIAVWKPAFRVKNGKKGGAAGTRGGTAQPRTGWRELRKKQAQRQGIDEDDEDAELINPNHVEKKLNISDLGSTELTRKEREAKEKQEAKERYWKLHLAGKTEEARSDLARLKIIKEEREAAQAKREAAQAKRKAEAEAKAAEIEAKKAAMSRKRI